MAIILILIQAFVTTSVVEIFMLKIVEPVIITHALIVTILFNNFILQIMTIAWIIVLELLIIQVLMTL